MFTIDTFVKKYNLEELIQILKEDGATRFYCNESNLYGFAPTLWITWGEEAEFRIKFFGKKIILSRIALDNRGKGIGTKVLEYLKRYVENSHFDEVVVESVLSDEMAILCEKCKYIHSDNTGYTTTPKGYKMGDYIWICE